MKLSSVLRMEAAAHAIRKDLDEKAEKLLLSLAVRTFHDPMQEMVAVAEKRAKWGLLQELREEWFGDDKLGGEGQILGEE